MLFEIFRTSPAYGAFHETKPHPRAVHLGREDGRSGDHLWGLEIRDLDDLLALGRETGHDLLVDATPGVRERPRVQIVDAFPC